jgi:uncharacterized protein (DUF885 family)
MKGYYKLNIFIFSMLAIAVIGYVWYLYAFERQIPDPYYTQTTCTAAANQEGSSKANAYFDLYFEKQVARSPEWQTYLGQKETYDQWTPMNENYFAVEQDIVQAALTYVNDSILACLCLDKVTQTSTHLFKKKLEQHLEAYQYRHHDYPIHQMRGVHTRIPSLLINAHRIDSLSDAIAYISRVRQVENKLEELITQLQIRADNGNILPRFLFPKVLETIQNLQEGYPIDSAGNIHPIYQDFEKKVAHLPQKDTLLVQLQSTLQEHWQPAYLKLSSYLTTLESQATDETGVWKMPNGKDYYQFLLTKQTTTDLTPDEIFELGQDEVNRIHQEMEAIMQTVDFKGDRKAFFDFMQTDQQFYYPNNTTGKTAYLSKVTAIVDSMRPQLPLLFSTLPKAELIVKAVEPYREKSAGKAFYQSPAPDGSRPGIYYANLYDMTQMPNYQMEALAYHEAIPGHHLQLSIAQEINNLPKFRRLDARYTAYTEGWGLYSEYLPKELGFYTDPYADFGRLAMELWRACRLVVDVGIHDKQWTRQMAIDYYTQNTPNAPNDCIKMVERHMVMPGQATTYKIGMITLLELRQKAKDQLGDQFDLKDFHAVVLQNGALPLYVLEDLVNQYIRSKSIPKQ